MINLFDLLAVVEVGNVELHSVDLRCGNSAVERLLEDRPLCHFVAAVLAVFKTNKFTFE